MISQVINLSNKKTFNLYKEKYDFQYEVINGLFGVEIRHIPDEIISQLNFTDTNKPVNIFCVGNELFVSGAFREILTALEKTSLNEDLSTEIKSAIKRYNLNDQVKYQIGGKVFDFNYSYVMGILNVTPDSFSDGSRYADKDIAISTALGMIEEGADIIDIGGESSRPGSDPVSETEELERVLPVINGILNSKPDAIISIDTTKSRVAKESLRAGASIVNDISGGTFEPEIFKAVSENNAAMVIMHTKGRPKTMQDEAIYSEVISEVYDHLTHQTKIAKKFGIEKIIVDPGIGFGKTAEHNLTVLDRLDDIKSLGFPVMIGLSRKSFIGKILNLPIEERDDATNSLNMIAMCNGARIIRTHDVKKAVQSCRMFNQMIRN